MWDGDEDCEHEWDKVNGIRSSWGNKEVLEEQKQGTNKGSGDNIDALTKSSNFCNKCGAWKGQLGLEPTSDLYVKHLMSIFNELKKVLKPTGLFFLNIGDTYTGSGTGQEVENVKESDVIGLQTSVKNLPDKCMSMIPERVMMAMVDNGWILRNKIIWNKPNPMPESVKDRFSTGYEVIYMFSLNKKYYFDLDAVREPHKTDIKKLRNDKRDGDYEGKDYTMSTRHGGDKTIGETISSKGKNPGDVWDITTKPFPEAHFAVYPPELCEKPIKAGCPKDGIVLDPLAGAGTTCMMAKQLNRNYIGIEISDEYAELTKERIEKGDDFIRKRSRLKRKAEKAKEKNKTLEKFANGGSG